MDDWVLWVIAAGALAVGEIVTVGFFLGPLAWPRRAAVVALVGGGAVQWIVFIAGGRLVLVAAPDRPLAHATRRRSCAPARPRSSARAPGARARGRQGGRVKIGGEVWCARAYDEDEVMEPGARVEVAQIDGATALVSE